MPEQSSIHWRRRWHYVLWVALLGAALGALGLWRTPVRKGAARVGFKATLSAGQSVSAVACASSARDEEGPLQWQPLTLREGTWVGELSMPLAYRRWNGQLFPGQCHERIVLRWNGPDGPRYQVLEERHDLLMGLLAPGRHMIFEFRGVDLGRLAKDIPPPPALP